MSAHLPPKPDATMVLTAAHRALSLVGLEPAHVSHVAVAAVGLALIEKGKLAASDVITILAESDPTLRQLSSRLRGYS